LSGIKKLAKQTMWYGLSSIAARFINYLLTPYLTYKFSSAEYGEMSVIYAFIPFMNVLFTYGMETAYFKFSQEHNKQQVYNTVSSSLIISTLVLSALLYFFHEPLAYILKIEERTDYFYLAIAIIATDTLSTVAFAKLRQDERPLKFAFIKITSILVNIGSLVFFLTVCPNIIANNNNSLLAAWYKPDWAVGYVLLANLIQSVITLLLLSKEFLQFRFSINKGLWQQMLVYALPLLIAGFGGMINETFDRIMLNWLLPTTEEVAKAEVGIYAACYKLSILITLAVQAFRMGAEPFFFKQAQSQNAPITYARVMKFFVITLCIMFLLVMLYLPVWKLFIQNPAMWVGLKVVPVLLLANMFLGIYYNLSIWYKLGNKTIAGAYITLMGAAVTIIINFIFIPYFGYMASAWATFFCYGSMMVMSYVWGQKHYPVPYKTKKLIAYMVVAVLLYAIHAFIGSYIGNAILLYVVATIILSLFFMLVFWAEKSELKKLPFFNRIF
jgi:O-antigen/teichoic acid export membrane protein